MSIDKGSESPRFFQAPSGESVLVELEKLFQAPLWNVGRLNERMLESFVKFRCLMNIFRKNHDSLKCRVWAAAIIKTGYK